MWFLGLLGLSFASGTIFLKEVERAVIDIVIIGLLALAFIIVLRKG